MAVGDDRRRGHRGRARHLGPARALERRRREGRSAGPAGAGGPAGDHHGRPTGAAATSAQPTHATTETTPGGRCGRAGRRRAAFAAARKALNESQEQVDELEADVDKANAEADQAQQDAEKAKEQAAAAAKSAEKQKAEARRPTRRSVNSGPRPTRPPRARRRWSRSSATSRRPRASTKGSRTPPRGQDARAEMQGLGRGGRQLSFCRGRRRGTRSWPERRGCDPESPTTHTRANHLPLCGHKRARRGRLCGRRRGAGSPSERDELHLLSLGRPLVRRTGSAVSCVPTRGRRRNRQEPGRCPLPSDGLEPPVGGSVVPCSSGFFGMNTQRPASSRAAGGGIARAAADHSSSPARGRWSVGVGGR